MLMNAILTVTSLMLLSCLAPLCRSAVTTSVTIVNGTEPVACKNRALRFNFVCMAVGNSDGPKSPLFVIFANGATVYYDGTAYQTDTYEVTRTGVDAERSAYNYTVFYDPSTVGTVTFTCQLGDNSSSQTYTATDCGEGDCSQLQLTGTFDNNQFSSRFNRSFTPGVLNNVIPYTNAYTFMDVNVTKPETCKARPELWFNQCNISDYIQLMTGNIEIAMTASYHVVYNSSLERCSHGTSEVSSNSYFVKLVDSQQRAWTVLEIQAGTPSASIEVLQSSVAYLTIIIIISVLTFGCAVAHLVFLLLNTAFADDFARLHRTWRYPFIVVYGMAVVESICVFIAVIVVSAQDMNAVLSSTKDAQIALIVVAVVFGVSVVVLAVVIRYRMKKHSSSAKLTGGQLDEMDGGKRNAQNQKTETPANGQPDKHEHNGSTSNNKQQPRPLPQPGLVNGDTRASGKRPGDASGKRPGDASAPRNGRDNASYVRGSEEDLSRKSSSNSVKSAGDITPKVQI